MPRTPEQEARAKIDVQLADCGWLIQDSKKADFSAGRGIAGGPPSMSHSFSGASSRVPSASPRVQERYERWLGQKEQNGFVFTDEQRAWLGLIRDHVATSLSIEPEDFDYAPFSHRGGLGKAHQVFGAEFPRLLDELNEALAA